MDMTAMITLGANIGTLTIMSGVIIFLIITLILVTVLLVAKKFLVHSGEVHIVINDDKDVFANSGKSLLSTLSDENIFLSSACGGKGSCGQCKVQVFNGGGDGASHRNRTLYPQAAKGPLATRLSGKGEGGHEDRRTRIGARCKGVGMRGDLQQECRNIHQGVHRGTSSGRAHELHPRLLCTD